MISGQAVTLTRGDQVVQGTIIFGSDNRASLMVSLNEPILVGGLYVNMLPLLMNERGEYQDLVNGLRVEVRWEL